MYFLYSRSLLSVNRSLIRFTARLISQSERKKEKKKGREVFIDDIDDIDDIVSADKKNLINFRIIFIRFDHTYWNWRCDLQARNCGWALSRIINLTVNINKYNPLHAGLSRSIVTRH